MRAVTRVYRDDLPTSVFRFVGEHSQQDAPSRVKYRSIQASLGRGSIWFVASVSVRARSDPAAHVGDLEVFMHDHVVGVHQQSCCLVQVVQPPMGSLSMDRGDASPRLTTSDRSDLTIGQTLLGDPQPFLLLSARPRVWNHCSVAQRREVDDADIHPYGTTRSGQRLNGHADAIHSDEPSVSFPTNRDRLGRAPQGSVHPALHMTHPLQVEPALGFNNFPAGQVRPRHRIESVRSLESRKPRCLARMDATEERSEGQVQPGQGPSAHGHPESENVGPYLSHAGERAVLLIAGHRALFPSPCPPTFFEGRVVELPLTGEQTLKRVGLLRRRLQLKLERPATICHLQESKEGVRQ